MSTKILIVDDDNNIGSLINLYIKKEGYAGQIANDGDTAINLLKEQPFDLVLLDIMMPGKDGFTTLKEIRSFSDIPVIMLTARAETMDKIIGLDSGADDYITKPFEPQELILRIKAILRRVTHEKSTDISYDNLSINLDTYMVKLAGSPIEMTPKEIELLAMLVSHPDKVFTREELFRKIWSGAYAEESRTVDVHIKRIREKIGETKNWRLKTVWGIGYKFETEFAF